ncbi:hypothetical protein CF651_18545 [Paenibacillus rigui]|uniref:Uncharacterized protein n=1 Tax=Paenibacillus rigui TaxID=554312 RepID=A0A229UNF1_9BACL|nr:hypothetical protein CF651_18545 [Paenibacillus rigui]
MCASVRLLEETPLYGYGASCPAKVPGYEAPESRIGRGTLYYWASQKLDSFVLSSMFIGYRDLTVYPMGICLGWFLEIYKMGLSAAGLIYPSNYGQLSDNMCYNLL